MKKSHELTGSALRLGAASLLAICVVAATSGAYADDAVAAAKAARSAAIEARWRAAIATPTNTTAVMELQTTIATASAHSVADPRSPRTFTSHPRTPRWRWQ